MRSEEHTSEIQSQSNLVCRLLLEKKNCTDDAPHELSLNAVSMITSATTSRIASHAAPYPNTIRAECFAGVRHLHDAAKRRSVHFFFNDTATTEIYTLSLHDALPILLTADLH